MEFEQTYEATDYFNPMEAGASKMDGMMYSYLREQSQSSSKFMGEESDSEDHYRNSKEYSQRSYEFSD